MASGLAVRAALADLGLARARLKWPNDLEVDGKKLSGILAETRGLDPAAPHCVVGIGVNVAQLEFPRELASARPVTSLALCGVRASPRAVLERLLPHFGRAVECAETTPDATCREYFTALLSGARRVRVQAGEESLAGEFRSADPARGLELLLPDGRTRRVRLEHVHALEVVGG
jgi:BirA family biotin operon repressor/biotin-[acetyl-CoA-carboxylase] ligase